MANNTSGSAKATSIETNDVSPISAGERHGKAWHLFTVWSSPNLEFATVFIGALAIFAGLNVWQAILAVVLGNTLAAVTHGVLSTFGPSAGLPQMVLGRTAFGKIGNLLPAGLSTLIAGIGWFAVNSVSGAFALQSLIGEKNITAGLALAIIVVVQIAVAFVGHNLIQKFERYAFFYLVIVFAIVSVLFLANGHYAVESTNAAFPWGPFSIAAATAYGYTAGWTPFASDYTRYLPANTSKKALGLAAGLGNWFATSLLMIVGAVAFSGVVGEGNPTTAFTGATVIPSWLGALTLLGIAVGSVSANVLNVYSGAMSFLSLGIKLGFKSRRAIMVAIAGIFGTLVAYQALDSTVKDSYEGFLLVVSYWVAPWIAIILVDHLLRKGQDKAALALKAKRENLAGPIAFIVATVTSIGLFGNQAFYHYVGAFLTLDNAGTFGDWTPLVGFILAGVLYFVLAKALKTDKK
ncbi:MAG: cytosine permease [Actinomycetales bacterium]|nr:cytosine permease [Actinomycetales bacterium]